MLHVFFYVIWQFPFLWEEWGAPLVAGLEGLEEGRLVSSLKCSVPWELLIELPVKGASCELSSFLPWNVVTSDDVFDWEDVDFLSWLVSRKSLLNFHLDFDLFPPVSWSDWGQFRFCTTKSMSSGSASSTKNTKTKKLIQDRYYN